MNCDCVNVSAVISGWSHMTQTECLTSSNFLSSSYLVCCSSPRETLVCSTYSLQADRSRVWAYFGLMASSRVGQWRSSARVVSTCLLVTLLTCTLRCSECAKLSNIILILTDDQDVEMGGMVSVQKYITNVFFLMVVHHDSTTFEQKYYAGNLIQWFKS